MSLTVTDSRQMLQFAANGYRYLPDVTVRRNLLQIGCFLLQKHNLFFIPVEGRKLNYIYFFSHKYKYVMQISLYYISILRRCPEISRPFHYL
ncbi:hypothetical protein Barb7_00343 [Bacteroidales bacterium Barb7]|nr:hypothetical protein Barb7_00343 [Bacteroidales bacterium Barb7]